MFCPVGFILYVFVVLYINTCFVVFLSYGFIVFYSVLFSDLTEMPICEMFLLGFWKANPNILSGFLVILSPSCFECFQVFAGFAL